MFGKLKDKLKGAISDKISEISPIDLNCIDLDSVKSQAIEKVADLDYPKVNEKLEMIPSKFANEKNYAINLITVLSDASGNYKQSTSENKEEEFITFITSNIDLEDTMKVIEPVWDFIPYGKVIKYGMNYIIKKNKKKK